jgi:ABC-type branched-subunit amino acid transport system substrate-binding protein
MVQQVALKLQVVYLPTFGCAAEEFSSQSCNRYSFRFGPVGRQQLGPLVDYIVKAHGHKWAMIYSDYAYGHSQLAAYTAELAKHDALITLPIAVPHNEPTLAPYVKKIPTDGSVNGVVILGLGAGDLKRVSLALGHYGIAPGVQVIGSAGRDAYGGSYPTFLKNTLNVQTYLSGQPPNNPYGEAYEKAWREAARRQPVWASMIGGADKALAFHGYPQYSAMMALKTAMVEARFTGRKDTDGLITALERVNMPLGPDAPGGAIVMNPADHQGAQTVYVYRVVGPQLEELLSTVAADQVPQFNTCHV